MTMPTTRHSAEQIPLPHQLASSDMLNLTLTPNLTPTFQNLISSSLVHSLSTEFPNFIKKSTHNFSIYRVHRQTDRQKIIKTVPATNSDSDKLEVHGKPAGDCLHPNAHTYTESMHTQMYARKNRRTIKKHNAPGPHL